MGGGEEGEERQGEESGEFHLGSGEEGGGKMIESARQMEEIEGL